MWTPSPSLLLPSWLHAEFNSIVRVIQDHNLQWGSTALMALKRIKLIVLAPEGIFLPQPPALLPTQLWEDANATTLTCNWLRAAFFIAWSYRSKNRGSLHPGNTPEQPTAAWDRSAFHRPPLVELQHSDDDDQKMHPTFQVQHSREWFWLSCSKQDTD